MSVHQAVRQGRRGNRPPTGYTSSTASCSRNEHAAVVRTAFACAARARRRATSPSGSASTTRRCSRSCETPGTSARSGSTTSGFRASTSHSSPWGFEAAHRGRITGRRRGRDLMAGRVRCGLCRRVMTVEDNGRGHLAYRCRHRGQGCRLPRRSASGLLRAAVLGIHLIAEDERLRTAIREHLARGRSPSRRPGGGPATTTSPSRLEYCSSSVGSCSGCSTRIALAGSARRGRASPHPADRGP